MRERRQITCDAIDELISIAQTCLDYVETFLTPVGRYMIEAIGQSYQMNSLVTYGEIIECRPPTIFNMMDRQNS